MNGAVLLELNGRRPTDAIDHEVIGRQDTSHCIHVHICINSPSLRTHRLYKILEFIWHIFVYLSMISHSSCRLHHLFPAASPILIHGAATALWVPSH